jgi:hypothetical protein
MRQELSLELDTEIQNRTKEIKLLRKDHEIRLVKIKMKILILCLLVQMKG